jgi:hypothetical protein
MLSAPQPASAESSGAWTSSFSLSFDPATNSSAVPPYAFNGAYTTYQATVYVSGSPSPAQGNITYTVSDVNDTTQSFYVNVTSSGDIPSDCGQVGTGASATFADPSPLFALNMTYTDMLNQGILPPGTNQAILTPNVELSVPAGTFVTDEVTANGTSVWIGANSGIVVKDSSSSVGEGSCYGTLVLSSTNINVGGTSSSLLVYLIIVVAVVVVVVLVVVLLLVRRSHAKRSAPAAAAAVAMSAYCPKCGTALAGDEVFCKSCGTKL